jgi:capsular polysaccharide biosynthesis protein
MAETTKEPDVLTFVKKKYDNLKSEADGDNDPKKENVTAVIKLIDTIYQTIIKSEATYDTIVGQLKHLQTAYDGLSFSTEYVNYKEANNRLRRIVDVTGAKEEKEEEEEEEEEKEEETEEEEEEEE